MSVSGWIERRRAGILILRPAGLPAGLLVAFSGRLEAPPGEAVPTARLARRFAGALGLDGTPILRATQVHGNRAVTVREPLPPGAVADAGPCDALATDVAGLALAVQTADCVPILLAASNAIGTAHAGWRGTERNAAGAAVAALAALADDPSTLRAWLGPSIGPCCYEVGGEIATRFAGEFVRRARGGRLFLDLPSANRAQLEAAGVASANISSYPACTHCGGRKYASYRRDGGKAGRMIGLVARLEQEVARSGLAHHLAEPS